VANEQAAALARAVHEDEAHRQADLREVAEKEAEAVPEWPPDSLTPPAKIPAGRAPGAWPGIESHLVTSADQRQCASIRSAPSA
jgi:hypothetical protein